MKVVRNCYYYYSKSGINRVFVDYFLGSFSNLPSLHMFIYYLCYDINDKYKYVLFLFLFIGCKALQLSGSF